MKRKNHIINQKKKTLKFIMLTLSILIASLIFLGCNFINTQASKGNISKPTNTKLYTSIVVEDGDTLWSVASQYYSDTHKEQQVDLTEYVNEIKKVNQLAEDSIHIGEYLTIPYYK